MIALCPEIRLRGTFDLSFTVKIKHQLAQQQYFIFLTNASDERSIETTVVPEPITSGRANMEDDSKYLSGSVIQPSTTSAEEEEAGENGNRHIIRDSILALKVFHKLKKRLKMNLITVITTIVSSITSTTTDYVTKSTKTFFIHLCTPSPFPFNICNSRKKREEAEMRKKQSKGRT